MSESDKNIETFKRVLEKYQIPEPTPVEARRHAARVKASQFTVILRRAGAYSVIFALVVKIFFTVKKMGIAVTIAQSAIVLAIVSFLTAGGLTTGAIMFVKALGGIEAPVDGDSGTKAETIVGPRAREDAAPPVQGTHPVEAADVIDDRLGVQPFTGVNLPPAETGRVAGLMAGSLSRLRGGDRVVNYGAGQQWKKSGLMLMGTVEKAEGGYTISARVVSVRDSRILFYDTETAATSEDLPAAGERLSQRIFGKIR